MSCLPFWSWISFLRMIFSSSSHLPAWDSRICELVGLWLLCLLFGLFYFSGFFLTFIWCFSLYQVKFCYHYFYDTHIFLIHSKVTDYFSTWMVLEDNGVIWLVIINYISHSLLQGSPYAHCKKNISLLWIYYLFSVDYCPRYAWFKISHCTSSKVTKIVCQSKIDEGIYIA